MTPVRWVSNDVSICYDSTNQRVVVIERLIDDKGRRWAAYDAGPPELLDDVEEPATEGKRQVKNP